MARVIYVTQDLNIHGGIEEVTRMFRRALPDATYHFSISGRASTLKYRLYYLFAYVTFLFKVIARRPQVAHINIGYYPDLVRNLPYIMMARLFGLRVVLQSHFTPNWRFTHLSPLFQLLASYAVRKADLIVHLSPTVEQEFAEVYPSKPSIVLPNAIEDAWLTQPPLPYEDRDNTIVFLGRYVADKGINELLEVAQRHVTADPTVVYELHGTGRMPAVSHDRIRLLPWIKGDAKRELLAKAKLLVLPSWREAFGLCLIEAMACGTPVVATRIGGIVDVVRDGIDGRLAEIQDPGQLYNAVRELTENRAKWHAASRAARNRAEEYSESRIIGLWQNLYTQLARGARVRLPYLEVVSAAYRRLSSTSRGAFRSPSANR